ncbi:hypothetical protein [Rhodococcus opacus]|nr:hypothetical protein [Rhodococcus opacus]
MTTAETLLAGPRGRRMLLAYARDAERTLHSEFRSDSFEHAVFLASYHLESGREGARVLFEPVPRHLYPVGGGFPRLAKNWVQSWPFLFRLR